MAHETSGSGPIWSKQARAPINKHRLGVVSAIALLAFSAYGEKASEIVRPASLEGFGASTHTGIWRLYADNAHLYAGTWNSVDGCGVFVTSNGKDWDDIALKGFGDNGNFCATALTVFKNHLYVGTWNPTKGGQLFRQPLGETSAWEPVTTDGFGDRNNESLSQLWVFDGFLYAACPNYRQGVNLFRSSTGNPTEWESLEIPDLGVSGNSDISSAYVQGDCCLVGTETILPPANGGEIRRIRTGKTNPEWVILNIPGFGKRTNQHVGGLVIFQKNLYAVTWNGAHGFEIWKAPWADDSPLRDWVCVAKDGITNNRFSTATCLLMHNETLIVGVRGRFLHEGDLYTPEVKVTQAIGGAVFFSRDGSRWEFLQADEAWGPPCLGVQSMAVFNDNLYVGTFSLNTPARVWRVEIPVASSKR